MEIISSIVQAYADRFSADEDEVLKAISDDTKATHSDWHMLSGHVQGKFLQIFSSVLQPAYILEIGTFTGYSAICLARGLKAGGELHTIELREDDAAVAQANFNRAKTSSHFASSSVLLKHNSPQRSVSAYTPFATGSRSGGAQKVPRSPCSRSPHAIRASFVKTSCRPRDDPDDRTFASDRN